MKRLLLTPEALARALMRLPGAYWIADGAGAAWAGAGSAPLVRALDPVARDEASPAGSLAPVEAPRWVGALPYESFRAVEGSGAQLDRRAAPPLVAPIWRRYRAGVRVEGEDVWLWGESRAEADQLEAALTSAEHKAQGIAPSWAAMEAPEEDAQHIHRVERALAKIEKGQLYQVNLARRFRFRASGHPIELLQALGNARWDAGLGDARFAFAWDAADIQIVSVSPEEFLRLDPDGTIQTSPIKGTRPRLSDPVEDARMRAELESSEKENAELTMVIDLERNDLARLARPGSVRLVRPPHTTSHRTVHHREAIVGAVLREGVTLTEILEALMPSGSVTGAPKRAAMLTIAELEEHRRGLYTGALGYLTQGGGLRLSMAIRCFTVSGGEAVYFAGGGIVADSSARAEVEETRWKAEQLARLFDRRLC